MPMALCKVSFAGPDGRLHAVQVQAESLYEIGHAHGRNESKEPCSPTKGDHGYRATHTAVSAAACRAPERWLASKAGV